MNGRAMFRDDLYAVCGNELFRNRGQDWRAEPVAGPVRRVVANSTCVYAIADRTVSRCCASAGDGS